MGRQPRTSGQHFIDHAKELFEQSVQEGRADFRLIALAIGAAPSCPPDWAIEACVNEKEREETRAAAGTLNDVSEILDEIVRFYDRWQQTPSSVALGGDEPVPSLREAIIAACRSLGVREANLENSGSDDWMRDVRRSWDWEQQHDCVASFYLLEGWKITGRIDRVLTAVQGPEFGMPADPVKELWLHERRKREA